MKLQGASTPRPMTHDLLFDMLGELEVACTRVSVTELRENTFYAQIILQLDGTEIEVDSRPSDAIALALRTDAPIFVADEVIEENGIEFDDEDEEKTVADFKKFLDNVSPDEFASDAVRAAAALGLQVGGGPGRLAVVGCDDSVLAARTLPTLSSLRQPIGRLADRAVDVLRRYVSILAIGALLLWLLPRVLRGAADAARERTLLSLGVGLLGFVAVIVALVLLILVTVLVAIVLALAGLGSLTGLTVFGGLLVGAILVFLLVLAVAFVAPATVGLALGRLLLRGEDRSYLSRLGALAVGVLVVVLVAAIPLLGGFLEALVVLLGLGALLLRMNPSRRPIAEPVA
jgi:bifunctional DNase/RNase